MNTLKKIIIGLGRIYFAPLSYSTNLYFKIKDIYYTHPAEHLFRLTRLIKERLNDSADTNVIIDIGAADGLTAIFFSNNIPNSKVYAYEPNQSIWSVIDANIKGKENIILKKFALGEKAGLMNLHVTDNNLSSSLLELNQDEIDTLPDSHKKLLHEKAVSNVMLSSLDEEMKSVPKILCIKMDVQGYELKVLQGGEETLQKTDFILIEMSNHQLYKGGVQYFEIDNFLRARGFRLADIVVSYRTQLRVQEYDAIYERIHNNR